MLNSHYYNLVGNLFLGMLLGLSISSLTLSVVVLLRQFLISTNISSLLCTVIVTFCWFRDLIIEATYIGSYVSNLRVCFSSGFSLFISSEWAVFFCLFWGVLSCIFSSSGFSSLCLVTSGIGISFWFGLPCIGTYFLVLSGYILNCCLYLITIGNLSQYLIECEFALSLGIGFLFIQYFEYSSLLFSISDATFSSYFFSFTGFHGSHVLIGVLFLLVECRSGNVESTHIDFCSSFFTGFILALVYWHFVDIIWLGVFYLLYFEQRNSTLFSHLVF